MKSNKYLLRLFMAAAVSGMALSSCTDNDTPVKPEEESPNTPGEENPDGKYVFATTVTTSGNSSYVLLTGDSLDEGELTTVGHGLEMRAQPSGCSTKITSMPFSTIRVMPVQPAAMFSVKTGRCKPVTSNTKSADSHLTVPMMTISSLWRQAKVLRSLLTARATAP